jgi:hypothetical protein
MECSSTTTLTRANTMRSLMQKQTTMAGGKDIRQDYNE